LFLISAGGFPMPRDIPERDWKQFRKLYDIALQRFCERVLSEVSDIASDEDNSAHDRYLAVYKLVKQRDKELARTFDDPRRSQAMIQLLNMVTLELITVPFVSHA
jgi:hypothetical protein